MRHTITAAPAALVPRWEPVLRPRLFALLDEATKGPFTLLAAPAGYGKTLLLRSWVASSAPPGPVAWVTVGPDDQPPSHFWPHVFDALRGTGIVMPAWLPSDADDIHAAEYGFVRAFVTHVAEFSDPVVLVLDDLHEATGTAVTSQLRFLLRHAPAQLRLVVATRADPLLSLPRLRVAGELSEIREAALTFTLPEARDLLAGQGLELSERELRLLWNRTEGWAAGLRLAALSLRDHPDPRRFIDELAGDDRAIAGYLVEEVLAAQAPDLRAFLLRTSVVDRVCGDLADALTGQSNGAETLARLEREHVFTSASGPTGSWYRYHRLFAELLRAELRHEHPGELADLHRRAAAWHAANRLPADAIRHALAGGDIDRAANLVTTTWFSQVVDGHARQLRKLVDQLPPDRVRTTPQLAAVAAVSRLALGELEDADAWLGVAAAAEPQFSSLTAPDGSFGERQPGVAAELTLARLLRARLVGDIADAVAAAQLLLTAGPAGAWEHLGDHDDRRALVMTQLGVAQLWGGELDEAAAHLEQARVDAARTARGYIELDATAHLALLEAIRGRLGRVDELARLAREQARRGGWSEGAAVTCTELAIAVSAYYKDELDVATAAIERATRAARTDAVVELASAVVSAWVIASRHPEHQGSALARLDTALDATGGQPSPLLAAAARAARARLLAAIGDDLAAVTALSGNGEPPEPIEAVTLARLQLDGGEPVAAVATLAPVLARRNGDRNASWLPVAIEALMVDAVAHQRMADHAAAVNSLHRALELAGPEGYRRAFVEGGMPVQVLLVDHLRRDASHRANVTTLLERLRDASDATAPRRAAPAAPVLVEPLSARELVVLHHLPSTLSAGEIADELYVSVNTVKTHIKSIYRKLDTNRRWDTVRRARQLRLL